jgi:1-acyl-sn-glycerol-3-phosphate acyltransferase
MAGIESRRATPMICSREQNFTSDSVPGLTLADPRKRHLIDALLSVHSSLDLEGEENLEAIRSLKLAGDKMIFVGNHRSMIDGPVFTRACETNGYKDIADQFVFLLGQKVKKMPVSNFFSDAFTHIDVWPKVLVPEDEEEKRLATAMTRNSLHAVHDQLDKGKIIVVFGEGTRSRDGSLHPFVPEIGHFAKDRDKGNPDTFIVPFALLGTQDILPVEKQIPTSLKKKHAHVVIGRPFLAADHMPEKGQERYEVLMNYTHDCVDELIPPDDKIPYCNREE